MESNLLDRNIFESIANDASVRRAVARDSHQLFFPIYLHHYCTYPMAEFQKEILRLTEERLNKLLCIVAFRGSAKSTLITLSYSLWSILGIQQKKFVLILCQTQSQARQHMVNLRKELEQNALLKSDLGPFRAEEGGEWALSSVVFQNTGARITVASMDQSIRGIRHREHRPDLVILDDIEDMNSTRTMEGRNRTFDWFTREIWPLGDRETRYVLVGNLLHEDSLMMRLKRQVEAGEREGIFKWYPLINEEGDCLWAEKFDHPSLLEQLHQNIGNEMAWRQEYLLQIVSDSSQAIDRKWIHYYDELPKSAFRKAERILIGVDLAISQSKSADYTAIVSGLICRNEKDEAVLFILPSPVNKRMDYPQTILTIKSKAESLSSHCQTTVVIEANGFQQIIARELQGNLFFVKEVKNTLDKRTRLALTSTHVQRGKIRFPKQGCPALIDQLVGLGIERHDDLADAFSVLVHHVLELGLFKDRVRIEGGSKSKQDQTICGNLMAKKW